MGLKILLIGEYSRLHNSLAEGLLQLGHIPTRVSSGDSFKNYNTDFSLYAKITSGTYIGKKIKNLVYALTGFDLEKTEKGLRFYFLLPKLKGYDHIQLINSDAIETHPKFSIYLYKKLLAQNKKMSLLICGDEPPVIDYLLKKELPDCILTPFFKNPALKRYYWYALKYTKPGYRKLFDWVKENSTVIIASDLDYKIPMERLGYTVTHIPNPVNTDVIRYIQPPGNKKIVIFLGINRLSSIRKGTPYFEEALKIIQQKYPDKAEIIIAENMPYASYIQKYKSAHIVLDFMYSMDQGYNALEAMAAGKTVFTGAGKEFMNYYNLPERVAIHAIPDTNVIVAELEHLINNPEEIKAIGLRASTFIAKEHNYIEIAQKYIDTWRSE